MNQRDSMASRQRTCLGWRQLCSESSNLTKKKPFVYLIHVIGLFNLQLLNISYTTQKKTTHPKKKLHKTSGTSIKLDSFAPFASRHFGFIKFTLFIHATYTCLKRTRHVNQNQPNPQNYADTFQWTICLHVDCVAIKEYNEPIS